MMILIGASASGKTEVARVLIEQFNYKKCITTTTRAMREGEIDGVSYHFVDKETFLKLKEENAFVESMEYQNEFYWLQVKDIIPEGVVILDPIGANEVIRLKKEVFVVYMETSEALREKRMIQRGDAIDMIKMRLQSDALLFNKQNLHKIDIIVENEDQSLMEIAAMIDKAYKNNKGAWYMTWFLELQPWTQALLAGLFTWGLTAFGASLVFFFKGINQNVLTSMLGFAAGVMVAASFWSLLAPAIDFAENNGSKAPWLVVAIGFLLGGIFLYITDKTIPHMHFGKNQEKEGIPTKLKKTILLVFSITIHNIPEGLAVGVAFGAINRGDTVTAVTAATIAAISLAIGIGIQNFPEGAAVSIPLRQENMSRRKAFFYGQASAIVEPIAAVLGALLVSHVQSLLPYALAFAAGAMIYVVVEELIPEAQTTQTTKGAHYAVFGFMIGFTVMMMLDVALG